MLQVGITAYANLFIQTGRLKDDQDYLDESHARVPPPAVNDRVDAPGADSAKIPRRFRSAFISFSTFRHKQLRQEQLHTHKVICEPNLQTSYSDAPCMCWQQTSALYQSLDITSIQSGDNVKRVAQEWHSLSPFRKSPLARRLRIANSENGEFGKRSTTTTAKCPKTSHVGLPFEGFFFSPTNAAKSPFLRSHLPELGRNTEISQHLSLSRQWQDIPLYVRAEYKNKRRERKKSVGRNIRQKCRLGVDDRGEGLFRRNLVKEC